MPKNDYALTHYFAEKYIQKNANNFGFKYIIFRLTNSYGCPMDINSNKWYLLLNDLCLQAYKNKTLKLNSNGRALRDFIWMGDVVRIIERVNEYNCLSNKVFNLSANMTYSIYDVAEQVRNAYMILFSESLEIKSNSNDKYEPVGLTVSNSRLLKLFPYKFTDHLQSEALNILKMLSKNK